MLFVVVTVTAAGEAKDLIAADNSAVQKAEKENFDLRFPLRHNLFKVVPNMNDYGYIKRNLDSLLEDIELISGKVGIPAPKLVAVTKSGTDEELVALCRAGALAIGENRPGELARRGALLSDLGLSPELHQIGTLQSNKAKLVCPAAALIHSLDSLSLAKELDKQGKKLSRKIPVLIEVNSAEEPQKGGILPRDTERFIEELGGFGSLELRGLMTMGPASSDAELLRGYFRTTRALFDRLSAHFGPAPVLSMGMSGSYRVAIEEGSTLVRVGTRLFVK